MRKTQTGVSLIELLTVVVIVAILAAIAVPGYRAYVIRANRSDAKTSLMFLAGALERCYTRYNSYAYDADPAVGCTVSLPQNSENGYYSITDDGGVGGKRDASEFKLVAVPQGSQASDTGCGNLSIDQVNTKDKSGTKPVSECWGK
jgi:type IV pilus assembly protein PilE